MARADCVALLVCAVLSLLKPASAQSANLSANVTTLQHVRAAGVLRCGVDAEEPEYSTSDDFGSRAAFDADLCRAVAVAVLGANARLEVTSYPDDAAAIAALSAGAADLIPTMTDDFSHNAGTHIAFTAPLLWDGVGFLIYGPTSIRSARQLSGKKICFLAETNVEDTTRAWFARQHLDFVPFPFQEEGEMQAAFTTGNCGALAGERTRLAQTRATLTAHGRVARLLPGAISNDPLAAALRNDDRAWITLVDSVLNTLIAAEELGVTQANAHQLAARAAQDTQPQRRMLLGGSKQIGSALGLDDDWAVQVITAVGNYGEVYERDLGAGSAVNLPRGMNSLHSKGGAVLAVPLR